jgi:hypothetical protein
MSVGTDLKRTAVPVSFTATGTMTTRTGKSFLQLLGSGRILAVMAYLNTAPTGATTFKVDVNLNGTTIFTTQANQPTWVASANAATVGDNAVKLFANGDRLSCDVDAIGSTTPGSDLTVTVWIRKDGD